mgnify:CR=1 FL=1
MHELSVCLSLLDQVQRIANEHGATRVERIRLRIGLIASFRDHHAVNGHPGPVLEREIRDDRLVIRLPNGQTVQVAATDGEAVRITVGGVAVYDRGTPATDAWWHDPSKRALQMMRSVLDGRDALQPSEAPRGRPGQRDSYELSRPAIA